MTTKSLDRIVELWPLLPEAVQADVLTRVEAVAANAEPLDFTPEELAGIEEGREDFKRGQVQSLDEFDVNSAAFMAGLCAKLKAS